MSCETQYVYESRSLKRHFICFCSFFCITSVGLFTHKSYYIRLLRVCVHQTLTSLRLLVIKRHLVHQFPNSFSYGKCFLSATRPPRCERDSKTNRFHLNILHIWFLLTISGALITLFAVDWRFINSMATAVSAAKGVSFQRARTRPSCRSAHKQHEGHKCGRRRFK